VGLLRLGSSFGLGYVLGCRAGRQRYEQLLDDGRRFLQYPKVQEASSRLPAVVQQRLPAAGGPERGASGNTTARAAGAGRGCGGCWPSRGRDADPAPATSGRAHRSRVPRTQRSGAAARAFGSGAAGAGGPVQQPAVDRPGGHPRPGPAALHPAQTSVAIRRGPQRTAQPSGSASKVALMRSWVAQAPAGPVDGRSGAAAPRACAWLGEPLRGHVDAPPTTRPSSGSSRA